MASCQIMRKGEVYVCPDCGIELEVVKDCSESAVSCGCHNEDAPCSFSCCGHELVKKDV